MTEFYKDPLEMYLCKDRDKWKAIAEELAKELSKLIHFVHDVEFIGFKPMSKEYTNKFEPENFINYIIKALEKQYNNKFEPKDLLDYVAKQLENKNEL